MKRNIILLLIVFIVCGFNESYGQYYNYVMNEEAYFSFYRERELNYKNEHIEASFSNILYSSLLNYDNVFGIYSLGDPLDPSIGDPGGLPIGGWEGAPINDGYSFLWFMIFLSFVYYQVVLKKKIKCRIIRLTK